jgi:hypothetical protein
MIDGDASMLSPGSAGTRRSRRSQAAWSRFGRSSSTRAISTPTTLLSTSSRPWSSARAMSSSSIAAVGVGASGGGAGCGARLETLVDRARAGDRHAFDELMLRAAFMLPTGCRAHHSPWAAATPTFTLLRTRRTRRRHAIRHTGPASGGHVRNRPCCFRPGGRNDQSVGARSERASRTHPDPFIPRSMRRRSVFPMAEAVRFELTDRCRSAVFKTAGLNRSPKPPGPRHRRRSGGTVPRFPLFRHLTTRSLGMPAPWHPTPAARVRTPRRRGTPRPSRRATSGSPRASPLHRTRRRCRPGPNTGRTHSCRD